MIHNTFKTTALLFTLLLSGFVNAQNNLPCGQGNVLNWGIFGDPSDTFFYADVLDFDGNPTGTDILLACEIANLLGKRVNFVQVESVEDGFNRLQAGTLDLFGGSALSITGERLNEVAFVLTDRGPGVSSGTLPLFFNQADPIAETIEGVLDVNPDARFGSFSGPGSIQYLTLLDAGVSESNIVVPDEGASFTTLAQFQALFSENNLTAFLGGQTCTAALAFTDENTSTSFACVNTSPDATPIGGGIAFNKNCCDLIEQVQLALNQIVESGAYANIIHRLLQTPYFQQGLEEFIIFANAGLIENPGGFWVGQPYANYSYNVVAPNDLPLIPATCPTPRTAINGTKDGSLASKVIAKYCPTRTCNFTFQPLNGNGNGNG